MHVVLVLWVRDDGSMRPVETGPVTDEDDARSGREEAIEEILREPAIDRLGRARLPESTVEPRVVDVHVEPVLVRDVCLHLSAVAPADVADEYARRPGVRGAVRLEHRDDGADGALVPEQPARRVRNRVGDRVPGQPARPLEG